MEVIFKEFFSVPNSSYGFIVVKIRAKYGHSFGKIRGVIRAKIWAIFKFFYCDLVHVQSVIDLFAKQLNNPLNLHKIIKYGQNHKYGRYTGNFPQMPAYTGMPV